MPVARLQAAVAARLHPRWRHVARHSWSFRLAIAAAVLSGLEVVMGALTSDPPIDPIKFAALSGVITMAAALARLFSQANLGADE